MISKSELEELKEWNEQNEWRPLKDWEPMPSFMFPVYYTDSGWVAIHKPSLARLGYTIQLTAIKED